MKSEKDFGENFFWVLGGIPKPDDKSDFVYYIIPSGILAKETIKAHRAWLESPGKNGQTHNDSTVRTVTLPPHKNFSGWDVSVFENRWDLIEKKLKE